MFLFMKPDFNTAGVQTRTEKQDQYFIINSKFDASMDVEVLASAFNMDKAEFAGRRILVDSFGALDIERLNILFADDPTYTEIGESDLAALDTIPAILVDKDFFMIFDNYFNFTENYNGQGLYWNYWYHVWKTFSISPFVNRAMFIAGTPSVTSVTVTPSSITLKKGQSASLSVSVETDNFAPQTVTWTVDTEGLTISNASVVTIPPTFEGDEVVVTATSSFDPSAKGTCTITVE